MFSNHMQQNYDRKLLVLTRMFCGWAGLLMGLSLNSFLSFHSIMPTQTLFSSSLGACCSFAGKTRSTRNTNSSNQPSTLPWVLRHPFLHRCEKTQRSPLLRQHHTRPRRCTLHAAGTSSRTASLSVNKSKNAFAREVTQTNQTHHPPRKTIRLLRQSLRLND